MVEGACCAQLMNALDIMDVMNDFQCGKLSAKDYLSILRQAPIIAEDRLDGVSLAGILWFYMDLQKQNILSGDMSKFNILQESVLLLVDDITRTLGVIDSAGYERAIDSLVDGRMRTKDIDYMNKNFITSCCMCLFILRERVTKNEKLYLGMCDLIDNLIRLPKWNWKFYGIFLTKFKIAIESFNLIQPNEKSPFMNELIYLSMHPKLDYERIVNEILFRMNSK